MDIPFFIDLFFPLSIIWVTQWVSYQKQELFTLREHISSPTVKWFGPCCSDLFIDTIT